MKHLNFNRLTPSSPGRPLPLLVPVEGRPRLQGLQETVHDSLLVALLVEVDELTPLLSPLSPFALLLFSRFFGARLLRLGLPVLDYFVVGILQKYK